MILCFLFASDVFAQSSSPSSMQESFQSPSIHQLNPIADDVDVDVDDSEDHNDLRNKDCYYQEGGCIDTPVNCLIDLEMDDVELSFDSIHSFSIYSPLQFALTLPLDKLLVNYFDNPVDIRLENSTEVTMIVEKILLSFDYKEYLVLDYHSDKSFSLALPRTIIVKDISTVHLIFDVSYVFSEYYKYKNIAHWLRNLYLNNIFGYPQTISRPQAFITDKDTKPRAYLSFEHLKYLFNSLTIKHNSRPVYSMAFEDFSFFLVSDQSKDFAFRSAPSNLAVVNDYDLFSYISKDSFVPYNNATSEALTNSIKLRWSFQPFVKQLNHKLYSEVFVSSIKSILDKNNDALMSRFYRDRLGFVEACNNYYYR